MEYTSCDLAIIGPGLTGMSAALAAHSKNPDLKINLFGIAFDSNTAKKGELENIPGHDKIIGVDLIQKITEQLEKLNSEADSSVLSISDNVTAVNKLDSGFEIVADKQKFIARAVILSTGLPELKNSIKGEEDFVHKGVSHCAVCDGALFRGRKAVIIGTGNFIARGILYLRTFCRKITVICPDPQLGCDKKFLKKIEATQNIKTYYNIDLGSVEIFGASVVQGIRLTTENEQKEISTDVVFIELKDKPNLDYIQNFGLDVNKEGFIQISEDNSTNVEGVFAAGTIRGEMDYAPILMGDGYKAGIYAVEYLER